MAFPVGVTGGSVPALFREAALCLLAARPDSYSALRRWRNYGTGGNAHDARPVSVEGPGDYVGSSSVTDFGGSHPAQNGLQGPGFAVLASGPGPSGTTEDRMFEIVGGDALNPANTDPWTATITFTPLYVHPQSMRFLWKYECSSLPISPAGLVIEDVDRVAPPPAPAPGWMIAAIYNGRVDWAGCGAGGAEGDFRGARTDGFIQQTRQVLSVRYDPIVDHTITVWRNGIDNFETTDSSIFSASEWVDSFKIYVGAGQICHAVLWHQRALRDAEIVRLHDLLRPHN